MHGERNYLTGLCQLHEVASPDERRALWRQGLAALANAANDQEPTPLEGLSPEALLVGVRVAISTGLLDDLGWLSKPVAVAALFELASALPQSAEKRELGRRVLKALHEGDAATFVILARALALGSRRALGGALVRARVALSLRLPIATGTSADGLALALLSRPELEREWVTGPSHGALPSRRLAARLIERAAREAARRSAEGDDAGVLVFHRSSVRAAWSRLLADRESLVWRHVATARGLLMGADSEWAEEVEKALSPNLGPSEWRRAAASLAASIAHDPQSGVSRCQDLAHGDLCRRDAGVAVALVHGLGRAGEEEPEAAEELLAILVDTGDLGVLEALVDVRREHAGGEFGVYAAGRALAKLRGLAPSGDDGQSALAKGIAEDLMAEERNLGPTLTRHLSAGLLAFAEGKNVRRHAEAALEAARATLAKLEKAGDATAESRQAAFFALRELDRGLLETSMLSELLTVSGLSAKAAAAAAAGGLLERLAQWIITRETRVERRGNGNGRSPSKPSPGALEHPVLRLRRLRTLLHLLDAEVPGSEDPPNGEKTSGSNAFNERRLRALSVLLERAGDTVEPTLRRPLGAGLARACDALVRDELCELSDILVATSSRIEEAADLALLAEASIVPEVRSMLLASAEVARLRTATSPNTPDRSFLTAFLGLAQSLPPGTSPRVEGLRRALLRLGRALERVYQAQSLSALRKREDAAPLKRLEDAVRHAAQLCHSALARLQRVGAPDPDIEPPIGEAIRKLDVAIERSARDPMADLRAVVQEARRAARSDLPTGIAEVVVCVLDRVAQLPQEPTIEISIDWGGESGPERSRLPPWLPPSRIVGGFYILRPIGTGGGGSVFVARRAEDRHDENAETFALKLPSFDGQNAHTLTEEEFLLMFREEAGALLTLPSHPNLAGFVTFDARARPKPILVMEFVRGSTLERIIEKRELSVASAFAILDGVGSGLAAMHASGIGHLDVKPGNIILREIAPGTSAHEGLLPIPVLVDFGLAGRKVRPGCASPFYGAPEVWDAGVYNLSVGPSAVDIYAFCCLAFELLAGRTLFDGDTLPTLISAHLGHDGDPQRLALLRSDRRWAPLADVLSVGLCRDPRRRASIAQLTDALRGLAPRLGSQSWPAAA